MKRKYETPVATEELFAANTYIAACEWQITSESGNNRMQCANPSHSHFMNGTYITSVWVDATNTTCQIIVDQSGIERTEILNGNNAEPARNAFVYGVDGTQYVCDSTYQLVSGSGRNQTIKTYYVPSIVTRLGSNSPCYGTYVNTGNYSEIMEKVLS